MTKKFHIYVPEHGLIQVKADYFYVDQYGLTFYRKDTLPAADVNPVVTPPPVQASPAIQNPNTLVDTSYWMSNGNQPSTSYGLLNATAETIKVAVFNKWSYVQLIENEEE